MITANRAVDDFGKGTQIEDATTIAGGTVVTDCAIVQHNRPSATFATDNVDTASRTG